MTDAIVDRLLSQAIQEGKVHGDGVNLGDSKLQTFLHTMQQVEIESHLPSVEIIKMTPDIKVEDMGDFPEQKITEAICKEWGETPDTLTSSYMAVLDEPRPDKTIVTQFLESTNPRSDLVKVRYQFARKGKYGDGEFEKTELIRFEFTEIDPYKHLGGNVLEAVGAGPDLPPPTQPDTDTTKQSKKLELADNQFLDPETGLIVTHYSIPIV